MPGAPPVRPTPARPQFRPKVARVGGYGPVRRPPRVKPEAEEVLRTRPPRPPVPRVHEPRTNLHVQGTVPGSVDTSYTHLIRGDLAPVGRVHLVGLGPDVGDAHENHILTQLDADSNMGANRLVSQSRRGPFKHSSGRSRVMDRSAHVTYRRRGRALEITVRRGVTSYEMDTLIGKLNVHRLATQNCILFMIAGKRSKLGFLDRIDLDKLRNQIHKKLHKKTQIGLLLQDTKQPGILHRGFAHNRTSKGAYRDLLKSRTFGVN